MRVNYELDETGRIKGYQSIPLDESKPIIEIDETLDYWNYKVVNNELVYAQQSWERINELKQLLADTDYIVIKISEGVATKEEYAEVLAQRELWREEIRELENN